jgi:RNA-directed DNA polymerase
VRVVGPSGPSPAALSDVQRGERGVGTLVRDADDFAVMCSSLTDAEAAHQQAAALMGDLGVRLHPDKTRVVDLRGAKESFGVLGWHVRARMSGKLWEQERIVRYPLRWPSERSMRRARARSKAMIGRSQVGMELEAVIRRLNVLLRAWGNYCYFRTDNSAAEFVTVDRYVTWRLHRLPVKKRGRNLHAGLATRWTRTWFHDQGMPQLRATIRYLKAA